MSFQYTDQFLLRDLKGVERAYFENEKISSSKAREYLQASIVTYINRFGSWNEALEKANIEKCRVLGITQDSIINKVEEYFNLNEIDTITKQEFDNDFSYCCSLTVVEKFGSWNNFLDRIGLQKSLISMDEEEIIEEIKRISREIEGTPAEKDIENIGRISKSQISNKFGTWNNALISSGFEPNRSNYTINELKKHLININERHPGAMTQDKLRKFGGISPDAYKDNFGTWNNALTSCDIEIVSERDISKKRLIKDIKRVSREKLDGERPTMINMSEYSKFAKNTFVNVFGSWNDALEASGFEAWEHPTGKDNPVWKGGYEYYYGPSWIKQQEKAMDRSFYCEVCREDSKYKDVHHITPARYWNVEKEHEKMNHLRNLVYLCRSCHCKLEGKFKGRNYEEFKRLAKEELSMRDKKPEEKSVFNY